MKKLAIFGSAAMLAMSMSVSAGTVDLFSVEQLGAEDHSNAIGGVTTVNPIADATILGGFRTLTADAIDGASSSRGTSLIVEQGELFFSNDSGVTGTGTITWDANGAGLSGTDKDLTDGGTMAGFELITIESDLGYNFEITAFTSANEWTTISFAASAVVDDGSPEVSFIPFSGFNNFLLCGAVNPVPGVNSITCGASTADMTNISSLSVLLNSGSAITNVDLRMQSVTTVPEPSSLALLGLGLIGAGVARRRKTQA